ncbi:hypothetical protein DMC47_39355 [Nostoc sp. 3335mG]|nr:hypothetical protein DMC47_39355 [Nostoc sp. 3335mG]
MSDDLPRWTLDTVDKDIMGAWVKLLRDANPIHVDVAAAQALGFGPHTVNPGPTNLAYAMNMMMQARPGCYPREIHAQFSGNILSDDSIEVTGTATPGDPSLCRATVRVPARDVVAVEAEIRFAAPEDFA